MKNKATEPPYAVCYNCGKHVTEGILFTKSELAFFCPVFCSEHCLETDDPYTFTKAKLESMMQWCK